MVVSVLLSWGFFKLQVLNVDKYREQSYKNSIRAVTQFPVRGNIYDRDGRLIVDNRPAFSLYLIPAQTRPETIDKLSKILHLKIEKIRKKLRRSGRFQAVKIASFVKQKTLIELLENSLEYPGLEWKVEPRRHYPHPESFSHILGTLGEINENEMKNNPGLEAGDVVGKKGIEKTMDDFLRGKKGIRYVRVDAMGRTLEEVKYSENYNPEPGEDVYLTIDSRLQQYADSLLANVVGALIAVDVRTGEVLTLVSHPNYNLNWFAESVDPVIWKKLISDTLHPLYARAYQSGYPPGSTFKLVAAIAALNEKIITPEWTAFCPGYYRIGRRVLKDWKRGGHGLQDLKSAIKNSCNVYFYQLGLKIGLDVWNKYSKLFRFGQKTGIELTGENPGLVPSRSYYDTIFGKQGWTKGMLANLAVGQGELLVTPLQMAQFAMILANQGFYFPVHLARKILDKKSGRQRKFIFKKHIVAGIRPDVFSTVLEGMRQVVNGGTGWRAGIVGISVAGKTGTAQNPQGKDHAWFIGFAPFKTPEIAVAVLIEHGGSGGGHAAPVAGKFLRRYFYYQGEFDYARERKILHERWLRQKEKARKDSIQAARDGVEQ